MNDLMTSNVLTMSSLEISELVGSRHDSVKRTIERCVEKGAIDQPPVVVGPKSLNQVAIQIYNLNRLDSITVVAQLSPEFTSRLVARWDELEKARNVQLTPMELLAQVACRAVEHERRTTELEEQAKELHEQQEQTTAEVDRLNQKVAEQSQVLAQIDAETDHFTIVGWNNLAGRGGLPNDQAAKMGTQASKYCKRNGIEFGKIRSAVWGKVNMYPKWVLDKLFLDDPEP